MRRDPLIESKDCRVGNHPPIVAEPMGYRDGPASRTNDGLGAGSAARLTLANGRLLGSIKAYYELVDRPELADSRLAQCNMSVHFGRLANWPFTTRY